MDIINTDEAQTKKRKKLGRKRKRPVEKIPKHPVGVSADAGGDDLEDTDDDEQEDTIKSCSSTISKPKTMRGEKRWSFE